MKDHSRRHKRISFGEASIAKPMGLGDIYCVRSTVGTKSQYRHSFSTFLVSASSWGELECTQQHSRVSDSLTFSRIGIGEKYIKVLYSNE